MKSIPQEEAPFMRMALELAREAGRLGETPVGAVVVRDGTIIGTGFNRVETWQDPTAHAEILALRRACRTVGDWRLPGVTIYVTLEPCIMCATAMLLARVPRVVYGARDRRWGGLGTLFDLARDPRLSHELEVVSGIMEEQAASLLREFFGRLRDEAAADDLLRRDAREAEGG